MVARVTIFVHTLHGIGTSNHLIKDFTKHSEFESSLRFLLRLSWHIIARSSVFCVFKIIPCTRLAINLPQQRFSCLKS